MNIYHGVTETRSNEKLLSEAVTEQIIGAAIEVHRQLGPGLLESVYEECMCQELRLRDIPFRCQIELPVTYKGIETGGKYRIDLIVADEVLVELKSVERILGVHEAQLLTYLKLTGKRVGLLINFNVAILHRGILRRVL
ncbi:MAG TPA: GxxExxY protein [Candidatus Eisenbacteria bacterium]|nr:GxxExxY protein [Candidatus Eisenbacteria bacterium]